MKKHLPLFLAFAAAAQAGPRTSANYSIPTDTADSGGRRGTSASYTNDGSVGLIAGFSSVSSPAVAVNHGYIGQIADDSAYTAVITSAANSGPGTLRDTLAAMPPGSTLTFASGLGTITLSSEIVLTKTVIIDASGLPGGLSISAGGSSRVFQASGAISVELVGLTIRDGSASAGSAMRIISGASVTLNRCLITGTPGGALGALSVESSSLHLVNSTVSACLGGTVSGVRCSSSVVTITHSTISGNGAGAAVRGFGAGAVITFSNSVVAGNTGPDVNATANGSLPAASVISNGGNLIGKDTNFLGTFQSSDQYGSSASPLAPRLARLGSYGGPTRTMPPLPGSPAIDAASNSTATTDQRGFARPNGPQPDIGAVEAYPFTIQGFVDTDNDGIDDRLEPAYPQFAVGRDDSALDTDGDGSTDAEELRNMTDPGDGNDSFRILSFLPAAGFDSNTNPLFDINYTTFPGLGYSLEGSQALTGFEYVSGSSITASGFSHQTQVLLDSGRSFVRARRGFVQWASSVIGFSSQYSAGHWSAAQALGTSDTYPAYGDLVTAWASAAADDPSEYLEIGFADPRPVSGVSIYETYNPGAVSKISVRNSNTSAWVEVWTGTAAPAPEVARVFTVSFPETAFPVNAVRVDLDSDAVPGWNEIDAVSISR